MCVRGDRAEAAGGRSQPTQRSTQVTSTVPEFTGSTYALVPGNASAFPGVGGALAGAGKSLTTGGGASFPALHPAWGTQSPAPCARPSEVPHSRPRLPPAHSTDPLRLLRGFSRLSGNLPDNFLTAGRNDERTRRHKSVGTPTGALSGEGGGQGRQSASSPSRFSGDGP